MKKTMRFIVFLIVIIGVFSCRESVSILRRNMQKNFFKNKLEFDLLVDTFYSLTNMYPDNSIIFGYNKSSDRYNFWFYPEIYDQGMPLTGGNSMTENSDNLFASIQKIGWNKSNIIELKTLLVKISCVWIRTTEIEGRPIEILFDKFDSGTLSYLVFPKGTDINILKKYKSQILYSPSGKIIICYGSSAL